MLFLYETLRRNKYVVYMIQHAVPVLQILFVAKVNIPALKIHIGSCSLKSSPQSGSPESPSLNMSSVPTDHLKDSILHEHQVQPQCW